MEKVRLATGLIMPILAGGFLDGGNDVMAVLSIVLFGVLIYPYMECHKCREYTDNVAEFNRWDKCA